MTLSKHRREENHEKAFGLMLQQLGDRSIDTWFFDRDQQPFEGQIFRTTWEELVREGYVEAIRSTHYRLTARGWLAGLEIVGTAQAKSYLERLGELFAAMKRRVKGRKDSTIVSLQDLAGELKEPEGWLFNIIESKASSTGNRRTGAHWFEGEKGRLIEIPVDFGLEPIDIANALTVPHLERIQELEDRLQKAEGDRGQFHCPYCDAPISGVAQQDYPEYHCIVTYERFECGYLTADGFEESPCPSGPNWPDLDDFEFITTQDGDNWACYPFAKTERSRRITIRRAVGRTKEEAEERAREVVAPKSKSK